MSHFTKLDKAQVRDPEAFVKAVKDLGFDGKIVENKQIEDYSGSKENVAVAVQGREYGGRRYDIGIQKDEATGRYNMVADWWGVSGSLTSDQRENFGHSESSIQDAVLRKTAQHDIVSSYARQGFMAQVQENDDKSINIKLTR